MKRRVAALAALSILGGVLGGCSPASKTAGGSADKFAGLDGEILTWRKEILAGDPLCKSQVEGQKCDTFEVACKAERTVTPDDQAKGISARVVTAMTWNGFDAKFQHAQSGSRTAEFVKGGTGWTRAEHGPVNMTSCADL